MIYRNRFTGGKADALRMWDAGEARFQVMRDHIEWGNGDYLVMALDINPPSLRVMKHEDFIAQYEEYPPKDGRHLHELHFGITDDPVYKSRQSPREEMLSTWVEFPEPPPAAPQVCVFFPSGMEAAIKTVEGMTVIHINAAKNGGES